MKHVVSLSGGTASAVAAHRVIERYGAENTTLWFADTKWEDEDLYRFLDDLEKYFNVPIQRYVDGTYERHYAQGKYQATDMIIDAGHGKGFCMGNIMKYAMRCGKKEGNDAEYDLLKIIHYAIIAIALEDTEYHLGETDD